MTEDPFLVWITAIFLVGFGLVCLFRQDLVWRWKVSSERFEGHSEDSLEQTPEWQLNTGIAGLASLGLGLVVLYLLLTS